MIFVKLKGGLGNQMFQYAASQVLASELQRHVVLDLSFLHLNKLGISKRNYHLGLYHVEAETFVEVQSNNFIRKSIFKAVYPFLKLIKHTLILRNIDYCHFSTYQRFKHIVLDGHFFDLQLLQRKLELIHARFQFRQEWTLLEKELLNSIQSSNSVGIHIRRGDYLNLKNQQIYQECTIDYYKKAMNLTQSKVDEIVFYIFSDDLDWAKKQFQNESSIQFVDVRSENKDLIEFFLLSNCKHNIIANSTYSWWAGFLNKNPQKIVVAPSVWYKDQKKNEAALQLLPADWCVL